jgi:hypothetical protein
MTLAACIRAAWPDAAGKGVARALDTTVRNRRRIAATGQVPRWGWQTLLERLRAALIARRQYLDALILQLDREIACDEAAATMAGSNRAAADRRDPVGDRRVREAA